MLKRCLDRCFYCMEISLRHVTSPCSLLWNLHQDPPVVNLSFKWWVDDKFMYFSRSVGVEQLSWDGMEHKRFLRIVPLLYILWKSLSCVHVSKVLFSKQDFMRKTGFNIVFVILSITWLTWKCCLWTKIRTTLCVWQTKIIYRGNHILYF